MQLKTEKLNRIKKFHHRPKNRWTTTYGFVKVAFVLGKIVRIMRISVLYRFVGQLWIVTEAEAIVSVRFVLGGQHIVLFGSGQALLFGFWERCRFVVLVPV